MRLEPALRAALRPAIGLAINKGGLPAWSPRALFAAGEQGAWYDPSDLSTLFQDSAGTTPVTAVGQPVGKMLDKSGRGNHASQSTTTARPTLQQDSGGRYYLSFDGVDDALSTATINFGATDKVGVFAGLRKLNDATIGTLIELSAQADSSGNAGTFLIRAPSSSASPTYTAASKGTVIAFPGSVSGYAAPISNVLTMTSDIPADSLILRIDGATKNSSSIDQGTGKFGNFPLYIGSRAGSSLYFNGRLYGLVVRGASSAAAHIASTERYLAIRSGVTL